LSGNKSERKTSSQAGDSQRTTYNSNQKAARKIPDNVLKAFGELGVQIIQMKKLAKMHTKIS
jgi:hypothetical protein